MRRAGSTFGRRLIIENNKNGAQRPAQGAPRGAQGSGGPRRNKKKKMTAGRVLGAIMRFIASCLCVCIILGSVAAVAVSLYVVKETQGDSDLLDLTQLELAYTTIIYSQQINDQGQPEWVEYQRLQSPEENRIWKPLNEISPYIQHAFVAVEDENFYTHPGFSFKRTVLAAINEVFRKLTGSYLTGSQLGASTIEQQLIKNITGDSEQSPSRKIREIFRAMELERAYSKDKILETYLNYIGFGGSSNGIEHAAQKYFGKSASELDVAEAACLAAIPKSPETLNPFAGYTDDATGEWVNTGKEKNRSRQQYVLWQMYDNGALTYDEYEKALHEKLVFTDSDEYKAAHPDADKQQIADSSTATSWIVDAAIYEVASYLEDKFNLTQEQAVARINDGGYQIYTTANLDMQEYVEQRYADINNLVESSRVAKWQDNDGDGVYSPEEVEYPESSFIAMDYQGNILAVVGAIGEKTESLCWNYATMEPRQPGSTIKPLTTYGLALESDLIHWGAIYKDEPIQVNGEAWPTNYSEDSSAMSISHKDLKIYQALEKSYNTVPAQLCQALTPQKVFEFATSKLRLDLCEDSGDGHTDMDYSPLTVGALTYGVTLENLVNGYIPYGNGGTQYQAHLVSKVMKGAGELVYENDGNPQTAVSAETSYVMNKLLQNVVNNGTGTAAKLENKHVAGKTGTTEDWNDLTFVGLTEDFVSGIWIGYTERSELQDHNIKSAQIWQNVIGEYANSLNTGAEYPKNDKVVEAPMCDKSGKIAGPNCTSTSTGYWKSSNAPVCDTCTKSYQQQPATTTTASGASGNTQQTSTQAANGQTPAATTAAPADGNSQG